MTDSTIEEKPKKSRLGGFLTVISILGLLIGLSMMFNKPIRNAAIVNKVNQHTIDNVSAEELAQNQESTEATYDFTAIEPVSSEAVLQDMIQEAVSAKEENPASFLTVAGIAIPQLGMNLPIYKGLDNTSLLYGAGTMKENQVMGQGNYALASHHMFGYAGSQNLLFSPLSRAQNGMLIYLTDKTKVYTYVISSVEVVDPSASYVIDDTPGKTEVTLVTCNDLNASKRIIVKGDFVEAIDYDYANEQIKGAFAHKYSTVLW